MYYVAQRKYVVHETVIVKAGSVHEAFEKASDDVDCDVKQDNEDDYEVDYQSIKEVAYVAQATKDRIG